MELVAIFIFIFTWIWSIVKGLKISVVCAVLNFFFPPLSQIIFSVYEEELRFVTGGLIISLAFMYWAA